MSKSDFEFDFRHFMSEEDQAKIHAFIKTAETDDNVAFSHMSSEMDKRERNLVLYGVGREYLMSRIVIYFQSKRKNITLVCSDEFESEYRIGQLNTIATTNNVLKLLFLDKVMACECYDDKSEYFKFISNVEL